MGQHDDNRIFSEHDWHSEGYVDEWIRRYASEDEARRVVLQRALRSVPFDRDQEIHVLDVGSGYGLFAEEALRRFPHARVTLLDYSVPMFEQARRRLRAHRERCRELMADLCDPGWAARVDQTCDLVVSGLAIHNLRKEALIVATYRAILSVLKPGGLFLDYDLFTFTGGIEVHREWLREAGFGSVETLYDVAPIGVLAAFTSVPQHSVTG